MQSAQMWEAASIVLDKNIHLLCRTVAIFLISINLSSVVAQDVIISEFMAINDNTLLDEDSDATDWIEIHNISAGTINLIGWHLTDNQGNLNKWTFPSVTINSDQRTIIFASDKNRTNPASELHTNFRLSGTGEYLALVRPDLSVAHDFSPMFPSQLADISYGISTLATNQDTFIDNASSVTVFIPPDDTLSNAWAEIEFDDLGWTSGFQGVGYDTGDGNYLPFIATDITATMKNTNATAYIRIPFAVTDPATYSSLTLRMRYEDGYAAYLNGTLVAQQNVPGTLTYNASANVSRNESLALQFEDADISSNLPVLVTGTNVLAIHGLNVTANSSDFLIEAELVAGNTILGAELYFANPTPGGFNSPGSLCVVADTKFSVDRGFYISPIQVAITTETIGAEIRYTLDGTPPTATSGNVYANPISISATTVLRAAAYKPGCIPANVDTHTYLFPTDIIMQDGSGMTSQSWGYDGPDWDIDPAIRNHVDLECRVVTNDFLELPTLSLAMIFDEMFGSGGIYIAGQGSERAVSMEMINPDGSQGFQKDASVQIVGGTSVNRWKTDKLSLRLKFNAPYSNGDLKFPVFGDDAAKRFDTLVLDARLNNVWHYGGGVNPTEQRLRGQYLRDQVAADFQNAIGGHAPHGQSIFLYINGIFWGIHTLHERPDENFTASYLGGENDDYDVIKHRSTTVVNGSNAVFLDLMDATEQNLSVCANYESVLDLLDIDDFIDYMLVNLYGGNQDWSKHNWYASYNKSSPDGRWRFHSWDAEKVLEDEDDDRTDRSDADSPTRIHQNLRDCPEYNLKFADHIQDHFFNDGVFTPSNTAAIYLSRANQLNYAVRAESARWGDNQREPPYTRCVEWLDERDRLLTSYFPNRTTTVFNQLKSDDLYPDVNAPVFSQHGGLFTNTLMLSISGANSIFYTLDGTDPREFWTGSILGQVYSGPVPLQRSTKVMARIFDGNDWSALTKADFIIDQPPVLRISEVMYHAHPPEGAETNLGFSASDYDYIEIQNTGSETVGLVGVLFNEGIEFDFTDHSIQILATGEHIVVVSDVTAFTNRYTNNTIQIAGQYLGDLDNDGERVTLFSSSLGEIISFNYNDARGWPFTPDGAGHSLIPLKWVDQTNDVLDYGGNWRASTFREGSPGKSDPDPIVDILINEYAAHTDAAPTNDSNDWIEFYNTRFTNINLSGWYLSDDLLELTKWAIPATNNAPPRGWIDFDELTGFHNPTNIGFGLNKAGEQILLSYLPGTAMDRVADALKFSGQENGVSEGRYVDGDPFIYRLSPTRGSSNQLYGGSVIIKEVMYHPLPTLAHPEDNDHDEFIVLCNISMGPATFDNAVGTWRISGDVAYSFNSNTTLNAGERLALVSFAPTNAMEVADFLTLHGLTNGALPVLGPYSGKLSNRGGRITLEKPQSGDIPGQPISWIVMDEVIYFDRCPWPVSADATGLSLHRIDPVISGNNPSNWMSGVPYQTYTDVAISKSVNNPVPVVGESITYTIAATNQGLATATSVVLADTLPAGVAFVSDTGAGSYTNSIWTLAELGIGISSTLEITVIVESGTGGTAITNSVALSSLDQIDSNILNDMDSVVITIPVTTTTTSTTTTTTSTTSTSTTTSTTSTTVAAPVIVDINPNVTLWAVYTPTGTITPMYSTNLGTMPTEWFPISVFSNSLVSGTNILEFDRPVTNASLIYFRLLRTFE